MSCTGQARCLGVLNCSFKSFYIPNRPSTFPMRTCSDITFFSFCPLCYRMWIVNIAHPSSHMLKPGIMPSESFLIKAQKKQVGRAGATRFASVHISNNWHITLTRFLIQPMPTLALSKTSPFDITIHQMHKVIENYKDPAKSARCS